MVIPITLLLAQVSFSCFHSHAQHMWMLAGSSTCVMALLHLSWRWIFRGRMNAGFAALNVAEATVIGVVATTFACSDHNNFIAYHRFIYILMGAFLYALIASLLSKEAAKSPMHHALCLHHVGFLVVFLAWWSGRGESILAAEHCGIQRGRGPLGCVHCNHKKHALSSPGGNIQITLPGGIRTPEVGVPSRRRAGPAVGIVQPSCSPALLDPIHGRLTAHLPSGFLVFVDGRRLARFCDVFPGGS